MDIDIGELATNSSRNEVDIAKLLIMLLCIKHQGGKFTLVLSSPHQEERG
jgi:hypothetical protein